MTNKFQNPDFNKVEAAFGQVVTGEVPPELGVAAEIIAAGRSIREGTDELFQDEESATKELNGIATDVRNEFKDTELEAAFMDALGEQ